MSTITLAWMIEQASPYLQFNRDVATTVVEDRMTLILPILKSLAQTQAEAATHESHGFIMKAFERLTATSAHAQTPEEQAKVAAQSATLAADAYRASNGWATGPLVDTFTGAMTIAGSVTRTPGRYNVKDDAGNNVGVTNEQIHPSVKYRFDQRKVWSKALEGFQRNDVDVKTTDADGKEITRRGFEWVSADGVTIPEYVIKPEDAFTRYVASLDDTSDQLEASGKGSVVALPGDGAASRYLGVIDRVAGYKTQESELS